MYPKDTLLVASTMEALSHSQSFIIISNLHKVDRQHFVEFLRSKDVKTHLPLGTFDLHSAGEVVRGGKSER